MRDHLSLPSMLPLPVALLPVALLLPMALLGCPSSPAQQPQPTATATSSAVPTTTATSSAAPIAEPTTSASAAAPTSVTIHNTYTGRINIPQAAPGEPPTKLPPFVIRDARAMAELISMIPAKRIQKKQPAPPSDDPLLGKPDIDLKTKMVIAVFRADTMYVHPKLENPRIVDKTLVIDVVRPPLGDTAMAAAQQGIGTYCAIVIDRFDGKIDLKEK